jgi:glycosyltransferase involved in cell wall biosynthesis
MPDLTEAPLVSVLMTVYNRELYLAESIESVLASTYTNFELIIVDDVSSDKSFAIAQSYAVSDSRIRLYRNEQNLGDYPNRNKAASYAKGKYIKYVDSDDAIFNWGLSYCVEQMEQYPHAALGTLCFKEQMVKVCVGSSEIIEEHFFKNELLNIGPSGTIFRKDAFEKIGFFDTCYGIASDNYVNIKLAALYPVVLLPKVFFFYRKHEGQQLYNSYFKYLLNNYQLMNSLEREDILPLNNHQKKLLANIVKKKFAISLLKAMRKPFCWKQVKDISGKTGFGIIDIIKSLLLPVGKT